MRIFIALMAVALCHARPMAPKKAKADIDAFCLMTKGVSSGTFFADPQDCRAFYRCYFLGDLMIVSSHMMCARGTHWSQDDTACVANALSNFQELRELCDAPEPCKEEVTKKYGYYLPDDKPSCRSFVQCDNGVSVKRCCPSGQVFDVSTKECMLSAECSDDCTEGREEEEKSEKSVESEEYEKGKVYTCDQGDYKFTMINLKSFRRVSPGGEEKEFNCPPDAPYFSYRRCTCYSKEDVAPGDRTIPDGVTLDEDECIVNGFIYKKTGVNTFDGRFADGSLTKLAVKECPAHKLIFRLETCMCDVLTLKDTLSENQCIRDNHVYEKVNDNTYKIADLRTRSFGLREITCPTSRPMWNLEECYCDVDPTASVPHVGDSCISFLFSDGLNNPTYFGKFGAVDLANQEACFDGQTSSYLGIEYFNGNSIGNKFTFAFRFKYAKYEPHELKSLLTNGVDGDQTVDISVSDSEVKVSLKLEGQDDLCVATLPNAHKVPRIFPAPDPYYDAVLIQYDASKASQNLKVKINNKAAYADCQGTVSATVYPMVVGSEFPGCVDDVYFCKDIKDPHAQVTHFGK